ncbi:hypothetical protein NQ314_015406 [Rhamnusium bicolor]|uniref:Uncharacterized protein n=1 Tax=Rhamnusium bicolor TaxID=1586634 RepID=A0AAV8WYZ8_9CUCU|nr:hypothetical protein NQ314_015406 [Rhamnusium bicolor]
MFVSKEKTAIKTKAEEENPRIAAAYDILKSVSNTPKDECFTFGQHLSTKLQKLDNNVRSVVTHLMHIIFDTEMGKYNKYVTNNLYGQTNQYPRMSYVPSSSPTYSYHSNQSQAS